MTQNKMTRDEAIQEVAKLIDGFTFCMLTTQTAEGHLHSRPITVQDREFDGDLWFIGGKDSEWVHDIAQREQVNVAFAQPGKQHYVSVTGRGELVEDRAKLEELWNEAMNVYFDGINDPNIQLVKINAHGAEFWASDSKVATVFQMAKSALTGETPDMGKNDTVAME